MSKTAREVMWECHAWAQEYEPEELSQRWMIKAMEIYAEQEKANQAPVLNRHIRIIKNRLFSATMALNDASTVMMEALNLIAPVPETPNEAA